MTEELTEDKNVEELNEAKSKNGDKEMRTVWKYPIPFRDYFELEMPQGADILTVQMQYNEPQLWALVDKLAPCETRRFRLAGTGHPVDNPTFLDYIGTIQTVEGQLVWHVFEILQPT